MKVHKRTEYIGKVNKYFKRRSDVNEKKENKPDVYFCFDSYD